MTSEKGTVSNLLVNYPAEESSEEEDTNFDTRFSPRKRRKGRKSTLELDEFLGPLDTNGFLVVETLLGDDFNWLEPVKETLTKYFPGSDKKLVDSCLRIVEDQKDKPEYILDLSSLELSQVVKHRRIAEDEEENDDAVDLEEAEHQENQELEEQTPSTSSKPDQVSDDSEFKTPKPRCRKFSFKPFKRRSPDEALEHDNTKEAVDVIIPEQLAASYGLYLWPSAPVLAWYLWLNQDLLQNKTVLELGSGTALPGLLCAKFGASKVYLTDDAWQPNTLKNIHEAVKINGLSDKNDKVQVKGLTWGDYTEELFEISDQKLDYIIGSDLFFDPVVFEPLLITISFLLEANPQAQVLIAVQERSNDWSIEEYLIKWKLSCSYIYPREFLRCTGIEEGDLTGKHSIFILKIFPEL